MNTTVKRNEVDWNLVMMPFSKKSPHVGKEFPAPVVDEASFDLYTKWFGRTDLISYLNAAVRTDFMGIYTDNIDEKTGIFNEEKWAVDAADFTAGVTRLADVKEQLEVLFETQYKLVNDENYAATEVIKDEQGQEQEVKTQACIALEQQIKANNDKIKPLKVLKAALEIKIGEKAEKRAATKAANEAKAAAAKAAGVSQPAELATA